MKKGGEQKRSKLAEFKEYEKGENAELLLALNRFEAFLTYEGAENCPGRDSAIQEL